MEAQVSGSQRKVVACDVRPSRSAHGASGIPVENGTSLPFTVERSWSAPAGMYHEQMFLVDVNSREVLFEGPRREGQIWGLQSTTEIADEVDVRIALEPGTYGVVLALDSVKGGEFEVEAFEVSADKVPGN